MTRQTGLDFLKFFLTMLVILGHMATPYSKLIFSFHMPAFFIISGFFIRSEQEAKELVKKDYARLIVPFFIFSILGLASELLKRIALNRDIYDFLDVINHAYFYIQGDAKYYGFVLWFFPALFWGRQLSCYLVKKHLEKPFLLILVGAVLLTPNIKCYLDFLPFGVGQGLLATCFLLIGYTYYNSNDKIKKIVHVLSFFFVFWFFFSKQTLPSIDIGNNTLANIAWPVTVTLLLAAIFSTNGFGVLSKVGSIFSSVSILIFVLHPYSNNVAFIVSNKLFDGVWGYNFLISLFILLPACFLKVVFPDKWIFKYV